MLKVEVSYKGNLMCETRDISSGITIKTDASGEDKEISPKNVLVSALASCTASMMAYYADNHGMKVDGMQLEVEGILDEASKKINKFHMHITLPHQFSEDEIKKLAAAAKACPVGQLLDPSITLEHSFTCIK